MKYCKTLLFKFPGTHNDALLSLKILMLLFYVLKLQTFLCYCRVYFITNVCYKYLLGHFLFTTTSNDNFILYLSVIKSNEINLRTFIVFNL